MGLTISVGEAGAVEVGSETASPALRARIVRAIRQKKEAKIVSLIVVICRNCQRVNADALSNS